MVVAAQRAYRDAIRWTQSSVPEVDTQAATRRLLAALLSAGIVVLGTIGLTSPATFGASRSGWAWWALLAVVAGMAAWLGKRWRAWTAAVLARRSWRDEEVGSAADALASCPAVYRTRYAIGRVWVPAVTASFATILVFAASYFIVDAVLARGNIGPGQALLCVGELLLATILLWIAMPRLITVRFAHQVERAALS